MITTQSTQRALPLFPSAPLHALDTLWLQIAGTVCNLTCTHCFISCAPSNHNHEMMSLEDVNRHLDEARKLGVKEYYLTGGEPLMNREIFEILEAVLALGPASVLTNGVLIKESTARRLRALSDTSEYSLDVRISIDGWEAATNDPIRGEGTFVRILEGVRNLATAGINPVITVTEACEGAATRQGRLRFLDFLREIGLPQPRLKIMPLLRIGAEEKRLRGYASWETLRGYDLEPADFEALQCTSARAVTSRGVYVCPILIEEEGAKMGTTLTDGLRSFELSRSACYTCHAQGLSCRT